MLKNDTDSGVDLIKSVAVYLYVLMFPRLGPGVKEIISHLICFFVCLFLIIGITNKLKI